MRLLRRAALDGHTAVARAVVLAALDQAALDDALRSGEVVDDGEFVALEELATVEDAIADEVLGLAAEDRLAVVLGEVPDGAEVHVVGDAHRRSLEDLAAQLQAVPDDVRVVVAGDPDVLPGPDPGAVLADLVAWGGVPVRDLRPAGGDAAVGGDALSRLAADLRRGELPEPADGDRSVVIVACGTDDEVVVRAGQLVTVSVPRAFGVAQGDVLVVTPLHRGLAGTRALVEQLPQARVMTLHEAAGGGLPAADAVVACFPGQAAGVLSRPMLVTAAMLARRHLSVVTAAGEALPHAVAADVRLARVTRLGRLLRASSAGG